MDLTNTNKDRKQRQKGSFDVGTKVYGKVPPQAKDLEEAILGGILLEKDAYDTVISILTHDCFYVEAHQRIFKAMERLSKKSQPIDTLTVAEELRSIEELEIIGGPYYLTRLTNSVVSSANIVFHCKIVLQKFIQREIIRICSESIGSAYEDTTDPFELLDEINGEFSKVGERSSFGGMTDIASVLVEAIRKIEDWRKLESHITGVPSQFEELDKATRGWQDGDLIILAARPSVGKTAFALNLIRNAAMAFKNQYDQRLIKKPKSVAVWSLEMKSIMLVLRMLAAESKEILYKIQTGRLDEGQMKEVYKKGVQVLSQLNILFDDNSGLTIAKLRSKLRKLKRTENLGLVVVDYLQLMTPEEKSGTREQEVSKISRELKKLAQEVEVPIIALSQMSRAIENRTGAHRVPQLSDLRESGSLEQDADVVMFLYGPTDVEINENKELINRRYIKIAKQRNGVLVNIELDFKDEIQFFSQALNLPGLGSGSWRPVETKDHTEGEKIYIDSGSKMEPDNDMPF